MKSIFAKPNFLAAYVLVIFWLLDVFNKIFIAHVPLDVLWYSSLSLLLLIVALLTENVFLLSSAFCIVFFIEGMWSIGFLSILVADKHLLGIAEYAFSSGYPKQEFVITLYHLLLVPASFIGISTIKTVHKQAWIGALIFSTFVALATFLLAQPTNSINCIYIKKYCQNFLWFLYDFPIPLRIFLGITLITLFIYIPTNYLLLKFGKLFKMKIQ